MEVPPPARQGRVSVEVARFVCQLAERGLSPELVAALCEEGGLPTARQGKWRAATVRRIIAAERADGDAAHRL